MCAQLFCSGCCYFLSAYSRDSRPSQLLQKVVFVLSLESGKSLWCVEKYVSKCHTQIVQALGYLKVSNDRTSQDLQKICGNLLRSSSFVSYGSVKILTSIFVQCLFV